MPFRCAFTIKSDTRYLTPLRQWISAVHKVVGDEEFPRKAVIPCSMALIEAVNNAIFHAHGCRAGLPIRIALSLKGGMIEIDVVDLGPGIGDPKIPSPDEMVTHGRGLFIIRNTMADVRNFMSHGFHHMRMLYRI